MPRKDDDENGGGYGRPPKKHQFKKGQSGNPKGRPRRPALGDRVTDRLSKLVWITVEGERKRVTYVEALIEACMAKAVKGSIRDARQLVGLLRDIGLNDLIDKQTDTMLNSHKVTEFREKFARQMQQLQSDSDELLPLAKRREAIVRSYKGVMSDIKKAEEEFILEVELGDPRVKRRLLIKKMNEALKNGTVPHIKLEDDKPVGPPSRKKRPG
ncbi:MAG: DUF5681 domain-containing protein [Parasphingopyxis sp.]|uniref:DUF5681 domain-containing protein n=1 Tax=Parasphingopyxis sp. TaxID=1920299 RepID=UPI0032EB01BB